MSFDRWRWLVVLIAVVVVTVAAFTERAEVKQVAAEPSAVTVAEVVEPEDPEAPLVPIPEWCAPLLDLSGNDDADVVAMVFSEVADIAPEPISGDLRVAADVLLGGGSTVPDSTEVTIAGDATENELFDAEGRAPENDPVVRVADHIEAECRRTAINPVPPPIDPSTVTVDTTS